MTSLIGENFSLKIVDVALSPKLSDEKRILVSPTLIKTSPRPEQRFIGDLEDGEALRRALGLPAKPSTLTPPPKAVHRMRSTTFPPDGKDKIETPILRDLLTERKKSPHGRA